MQTEWSTKCRSSNPYIYGLAGWKKKLFNEFQEKLTIILLWSRGMLSGTSISQTTATDRGGDFQSIPTVTSHWTWLLDLWKRYLFRSMNSLPFTRILLRMTAMRVNMLPKKRIRKITANAVTCNRKGGIKRWMPSNAEHWKQGLAGWEDNSPATLHRVHA